MRSVSRALVLLTLLCPTLAWAFPSGIAHVDPKAPCFRWPAVDMDGDGVFDRVDNCVSTPKGCVVDAHGCHSDADGDGVCNELDACPGTSAGDKVDDRGCSDSQRGVSGASASPSSESERQLVEHGRIRLENVYFDRLSSRLLPESQQSLDEAGSALAKYPNLRLEVEGHSDTRGTEENNLRLSQARADAVRSYLIQRHGLRADQVTARGYGESRPETQERNEEELLRNRRVEIRVLNPEALPRGVKVENKP